MKIYTKTGDEGNASLPDGRRVSKSDVRFEALGSIDELNAHIGLCLAGCGSADANVAQALGLIQSELLSCGSAMAAPGLSALSELLGESSVHRLEGQIDQMWSITSPLTHFILPGGCELACRLHVARTVCRRAERCVVSVDRSGQAVAPLVLKYLNRLSDLLFVLARMANHNAGLTDTVWRG